MHQLQKAAYAGGVVFAAGIILDQAIKTAVLSRLADETSRLTIFPGVFALVRHTNPGAIASAPIPNLLVAALGVLALILVAMNFNRAPIGAALVAAGGASNIVDRIIWGGVRDPFEFFHLSAINAADIMIIVGLLMILIRSGRGAISHYG